MQLLDSDMVDEQVARWDQDGDKISDECAATIASWWMSPGKGSEELVKLAHGIEYDPVALRAEVEREIEASLDGCPPNLLMLAALNAWITVPGSWSCPEAGAR